MRIFESELFLYGLIFFAVVLAVEAVTYVLAYSRQGRRRVNRRLSMLEAGKDPDKVYSVLRPRPPSWVNIDGTVSDFYLWLDKMLLGAGISVRADRFLITMGLATIGAFIVLLPVAFNPSIHLGAFASPAAILGALFLGIALPLMIANNLRDRRLKKFSEQLPPALDVMVRALKAGHPAAGAVDLVTAEMADPIGTEFGLLTDEITYGLDFKEALDNMAQRLGLQDVRYFAVCVTIQSNTGGNLAEILENLAAILRARFSLFRKVKALSSEARMSAWILSLLPLTTVSFIFWQQPRFYMQSVDDPVFWPSVAFLLGQYVLGIWVIKRMVNIRV